MELAYMGSNYSGWQEQINAPSVQQTLQEALSTLLQETISVVGAGRTDTGVHASYYVVHFDVTKPIEESEDFVYHLNSILPHDIAIARITPVSESAHARFDAVQREYKYFIITHKNPFRREVSWQYYIALDEKLMNEAAAIITKNRDFTSFCKLHSNNKTNDCELSYAHWQSDEQGALVFTIRSNRFLRNMIRSLVSSMVDVGRGKLSVGEFEQILKAKDNSLSTGSAPAQGLFLTDIKYPDDIFASNKTLNK